MSDFKTLSIVVPIRECAHTLASFFENISLLPSDVEVLLVYYHSTDATLDVCMKYSARVPSVMVVNADIPGIYEAMNIGMAASSGRYILFMGSDDRIDLAGYGEIIKYIKNDQDYPLVLIPVCIVKGESRIVRYPINYPIPAPHHHQGLLFNREFLIRNAILYDLRYKIHSDFDFIQRCLSYATPLLVDTKYHLVDFRAGGLSSSRRRGLLALTEVAYIFISYGGGFTIRFYAALLRKLYYIAKVQRK